MDHNHGAMQSTPWNMNLDYAADWSIALGVPVVLLTVRHLFLSISRAIKNRRRGGQGHAPLAAVDSTEAETDELGVDIPTRYSLHPLHFLTKQIIIVAVSKITPLFFFFNQSHTSSHLHVVPPSPLPSITPSLVFVVAVLRPSILSSISFANNARSLQLLAIYPFFCTQAHPLPPHFFLSPSPPAHLHVSTPGSITHNSFHIFNHPHRLSKSSATTARWSYSRIENWITNKASATLYLGSVVHLVAGATLLALIFLSILAVLLTSDVNLKLNSNRAGYLGLACIPFLFAFTGKNSIISLMTGISHHRINQVHRFLGLSLFVLISVHMGCMMKSWWPWKALLAQQLATPKVRYGLATYATLCLLVVTAAWPVRRFAYEAFVVSHSLFLVFLVLVGLHTPYAMRFTAAGIFFYVINVLTGWCVKSKMALAQATVFQDRLTRLRMDRSVAHAPGQHIFVCVPSMSLIQWHPFTISSSDQTSLTVHARAVGGFTKKLCRWPENTQRRVILAGPYGESVQVGRSLDIEKVVFIAAGSGLAYIVPILMDFLQARRQSKASCSHVEIVWCVRDPGKHVFYLVPSHLYFLASFSF